MCRAEIDRLQTRISVHLFYQGKIELECSRCLKIIEHTIAGDCYVFLKHGSRNKNSPEDDEECDFFFNDTTEEIDIRSVLFDDVILSLPLKPLCFEACPGIPLTVNGDDSVQDKKQGDPRWEGLKKINHSPTFTENHSS
jgi:uncharacterized protein